MIIALARLTRRGTFLLGLAVGCSHASSQAPVQVSPAAAARSTVLDDTVAKVLGRALTDSAFPGAIAAVGNHG